MCLPTKLYRGRHMTIFTGDKFGKLTIVGQLPDYFLPSGRKEKRYQVQCDCGRKEARNHGTLLRNPHGGCCLICATSGSANHQYKHGNCQNYDQTSEYIAWRAMLGRCNNPKGSKYRYYGGRGIKVCERWLVFANFLQDLGPKPTPEHTLERKNNNGDYGPDNCKWATLTEQNRNSRQAKLLTIDGQTKCLREWQNHYRRDGSTYRSRIRKHWPSLAALQIPTQEQLLAEWFENNPDKMGVVPHSI